MSGDNGQRTDFIIDHCIFLVIFIIITILAALQLINDRVITKRNEVVGHMQRIFHGFTFVGGATFSATICVMIITALPNRGAMPDTPHWISDLLYDIGVQCAYSGSFFWVHHNVQQQQYLSSSSGGTGTGTSTLSRFGGNGRLTTILASSLWIIAGTVDTTQYITNVAWINAIYFCAMIIVGCVIIGISNYTGYQLLRALVPANGLVTDQLSHQRRVRSASQLKRFIWAYNGIFLLVFVGELDNIISYLTDLDRQWQQIPPSNIDDFRYEFDPLMVLAVGIFCLFLWHSWRSPTFVPCQCCHTTTAIIEPVRTKTHSSHMASGTKSNKHGNGNANGNGAVNGNAGSLVQNGNGTNGAKRGSPVVSNNRVMALTPIPAPRGAATATDSGVSQHHDTPINLPITNAHGHHERALSTFVTLEPSSNANDNGSNVTAVGHISVMVTTTPLTKAANGGGVASDGQHMHSLPFRTSTDANGNDNGNSNVNGTAGEDHAIDIPSPNTHYHNNHPITALAIMATTSSLTNSQRARTTSAARDRAHTITSSENASSLHTASTIIATTSGDQHQHHRILPSSLSSGSLGSAGSHGLSPLPHQPHPLAVDII